MISSRRVAGFLVAVSLVPSMVASSDSIDIRDGDRIVFLGNTFAERLRHTGYFETGLLLRYPERNLTFRNLGWSADEVALRPRPLNFGDIHTHLSEQRADVIFLFYGVNEAFNGPDGISLFRDRYHALLDDLLGHQYNGATAPRLVLVTPIPLEPYPRLPDVGARNRNIAAYAAAIAAIAASRDLPVVDLYPRFGEIFSSRPLDAPRLTVNGMHLNDAGAWLAALLMLDEIGAWTGPQDIRPEAVTRTTAHASLDLRDPAFLPPPEAVAGEFAHLMPTLRVPGLDEGRYRVTVNGESAFEANAVELAQGVSTASRGFARDVEEVREQTQYKNRQFFDKWRAVNGYYVYGGRKEPFGVVNFPPEMRRFDELIAEEEARILDRLARPIAATVQVQPVDGVGLND